MRTNLADLVRLAVSVALPLSVGALGAIATSASLTTWYTQLNRPSWTPPDWLFGPVWTLLYVLMGVALWLVWRKGLDAPGVRAAMLLFAIQLALNLLWSLLFFGAQSPALALVEIVVLWVAIALTIRAFRAAAPVAGWLLVPYLAWVTFAAALNAAIWWLNS